MSDPTVAEVAESSVVSQNSNVSATLPTNLAARFDAVRKFTDRLTQSLSPEDCMVQSMEDASPVRWHLAHTTWFFETFVLKQDPNYAEFDEHFAYLFNSYYNTIGEQFPRPQRGTISRPGLEGIREYRAYVDRELIERLRSPKFVSQHGGTIEVGLNHEQQHQELILTDFKHALAANPMLPAYEESPFASFRSRFPMTGLRISRRPARDWSSIAGVLF